MLISWLSKQLLLMTYHCLKYTCTNSWRYFPSLTHHFTRRFGNTRSWKVALKCLILLHRLLRSLPEDSPVRAELLWIRSNGLLSLYPCHFRDDSSSNPEAYAVFIRSYAQLLDQALDCFSLDNKETEEEVMHERLQHKIKQVSRKLELLPRLQSLIDRVLDCIPAGVAPRSLIVQQAMKHIIRDSFINLLHNFSKRDCFGLG